MSDDNTRYDTIGSTEANNVAPLEMSSNDNDSSEPEQSETTTTTPTAMSSSDDDNTGDTTTAIIISQFLAFTASNDSNVARHYLEMSGGDLEMAVSLFMEVGGENNEHTKGGNGGNGVEEEERSRRHQGDWVPTSAEGELINVSDSGNNMNEDVNVEEEASMTFSEPDYDYLDNNDDNEEANGDDSSSNDDDIAHSSPDYDHLAFDCNDDDNLSATYFKNNDTSTDNANQDTEIPTLTSFNELRNETNTIVDGPNKEAKLTEESHCYAEEEEEEVDMGEEYILGTMMIRVLQARHVKLNPNNSAGGGGGIASLLSNHRRNRHQRATMSPASAGGGGGILTPGSYHNNQQQQLYAKLSYKSQSQSTSMAMEHGMNGGYHWSRGDQSYFDVTCPSVLLRMGNKMQQQQTFYKGKQKSSDKSLAGHSREEDVSCSKSKQQSQTKSNGRRPPPPLPMLQLSLYSKPPGGSTSNHKPNKHNNWIPYLNNKSHNDHDAEKNDDYLIGTCSINVLQILSGKTPYFDEWCTIHNDQLQNNNHNSHHNHNYNNSFGDTAAGRVRIVIEYEPTDPPPRPGDTCVFAHVYPLQEELYPIPLHSITNTVRSVRSSHSMSTLSSTSLSSAAAVQSSSSHTIPSLTSLPKTYKVEEVVGDHIVLSYQTPHEHWHVTFEVHRYLLLCTQRYQPTVEKYKEHILDLCDNISQSPAMNAVVHTVETLPEEGLVFVGKDLVDGSVDMLGRWWENGLVDGLMEDVVDGINLDGRYSHLSEDDEEEEVVTNEEEVATDQGPIPNVSNMTQIQVSINDNERKALPGMPCCPITGLPMIEPVVAADGHTYERHAIARWLQTSDNYRSPLTGEVLAHGELVPNYLLLSSLGGNERKREDHEESAGLVDVL